MFAIQENNKENQLYTACGVRKSNPSGFTRARRLKAEREKEEQDQRDMKWLTTVRTWTYPENENNNETSGI